MPPTITPTRIAPRNSGDRARCRRSNGSSSSNSCGAPQEFDDEDPLLRRQRARSPEFRGAIRVGVIVGGILGLILGLFFGALIYRDSEPGTVILLSILHGLGFAVLG